MDLVPFIEAAAPYIFGGGGWIAVAKLWSDSRKLGQERAETASKERIDLVKLAQEAAAASIEDLREDIDRERDQHAETRERLEKVETEFRGFRSMHDGMIADKDAKISLLEGEKRMLEAEVLGLKSLLERHQIPLPKQGQQYWKVEAAGPGRAKLVGPEQGT